MESRVRGMRCRLQPALMGVEKGFLDAAELMARNAVALRRCYERFSFYC